MVRILRDRRIVSEAMFNVAKRLGLYALLEYAKVDSGARRAVERELEKLKFRCGEIACVRTRELRYDVYLRRWMVVYKCSGIGEITNVPLLIDEKQEAEIVEKFKEEVRRVEHPKCPFNKHMKVFIPRVEDFRMIWENMDFINNTVNVHKYLITGKTRVLYGFGEDTFYNIVKTTESSLGRGNIGALVTLIEGELAVYQAVPMWWGACLPATLEVTEGPDKGTKVKACLGPIQTMTGTLVSVNFGKIANEVIKDLRNGKIDEFTREVIEALKKEVAQTSSEPSRELGTPSSSKGAGGRTSIPEISGAGGGQRQGKE